MTGFCTAALVLCVTRTFTIASVANPRFAIAVDGATVTGCVRAVGNRFTVEHVGTAGKFYARFPAVAVRIGATLCAAVVGGVTSPRSTIVTRRTIDMLKA